MASKKMFIKQKRRIMRGIGQLLETEWTKAHKTKHKKTRQRTRR